MSGVKGRSGRKGSYAKQLSKALGLIDRDLPDLVDKLLEKAKNGDRESLIYLIDRRLGKPKASAELEVQGLESIGPNVVQEIFKLVDQRRQQIPQIQPSTAEDAPQLPTTTLNEDNISIDNE